MVSGPGEAPFELTDLLRYCNWTDAGLMKQKHPEQLERVGSLPPNSTGTILEAELRARFGEAS